MYVCATRQRSSNEGLGIHREARANCVAQRSAWQGSLWAPNLTGRQGALPRPREGKEERELSSSLGSEGGRNWRAWSSPSPRKRDVRARSALSSSPALPCPACPAQPTASPLPSTRTPSWSRSSTTSWRPTRTPEVAASLQPILSGSLGYFVSRALLSHTLRPLWVASRPPNGALFFVPGTATCDCGQEPCPSHCVFFCHATALRLCPE